MGLVEATPLAQGFHAVDQQPMCCDFCFHVQCKCLHHCLMLFESSLPHLIKHAIRSLKIHRLWEKTCRNQKTGPLVRLCFLGSARIHWDRPGWILCKFGRPKPGVFVQLNRSTCLLVFWINTNFSKCNSQMIKNNHAQESQKNCLYVRFKGFFVVKLVIFHRPLVPWWMLQPSRSLVTVIFCSKKLVPIVERTVPIGVFEMMK